MYAFKPTIPSTLTIDEDEVSDETLVWQKAIDSTHVIKEMSGITGLDLHPVTSSLLVTSSRITLYDAHFEGRKNFYNTSPLAKYGGVFRPNDGRLVCIGGQSGKIFIYDSESAKPLRELHDPKHPHKGPVRRPLFFGQHKIISCSDDKTIKIWDLADGKLLRNFGTEESEVVHENHIRASCFVDFNNYFASGSYDSTVKIWDPNNPQTPIGKISCPAPVEAVVSKKNLIVVAAGKSIVVYDLMASKTFLTLKNIHSQVITGLGTRGNNLISCSLDSFLKIFSSSFTEVLKFKHDSSKLTRLAIDERNIVVGSGEAEVIVRGVKSSIVTAFEKGVSGDDLASSTTREEQYNVDVFVERATKRKRKGTKLKPFDRSLQKFEHSRALDEALEDDDPCATVSLMQELIRRNMLAVASAGRGGESLDTLFNFVVHNLSDARFQRTLLDVATTLIDVYASQVVTSVQVRQHLERLNKIINREAEQMILMKQLAGQLEAIQSCM